MAAAFELSGEGWRERFSSITVYQQGFRLGGKGASGRGRYDRIEEHGLHIWLGFYREAFRVLGGCYDELRRATGTPLATMDEAFERASVFIIEEQIAAGWVPWIASFPETADVPWKQPAPPPPSLSSALVQTLRLSRAFLSSLRQPPGTTPVSDGLTLEPVQGDRPLEGGPVFELPPVGPVEMLLRWLEELWNRIRLLGAVPTDALLGAAIAVAERIDSGTHLADVEVHDALTHLIDGIAGRIQEEVMAHQADAVTARRMWNVIDVLLACARGVLAHGLLRDPEGILAVDHYDFAEWLRLNGADPDSAFSPLVKTIAYDLQFSYQDGDPARPRVSAATALTGLMLLFFDYRGAIAWKMRAGMGDVVFAPMYEALVRRGVTFEFFHRVDALRLTPDGTHVGAIEVSVQAEPRDPKAGYRPLVDVKGLPCWPAEPLTEQLRGAKGMTAFDAESFWSPWKPVRTEVLELGKDFDEVVLGIPVGSHHFVCADLVAHHPHWRHMTEHVATIYTQAFQLWLTPTMDELGCEWPPATTGGYLEPFDTYADMRQLIERESWPASHPVGSIAYFCNAMPTPTGWPDPFDSGLPARAQDKVKATAIQFLRHDMADLWPGGVDRYPTDFRWSLLVDPSGAEGRQRFDSQFWRANVDPSERYVLALPGTARYRLKPDGSGYDNLWLAGDWTLGPLNGGCVEAAVVSGVTAAHGLLAKVAAAGALVASAAGRE